MLKLHSEDADRSNREENRLLTRLKARGRRANMIISSTFYTSLNLTSAIRAVRIAYQGKGSSTQDVMRQAQIRTSPSFELPQSKAPAKPELLAVGDAVNLIL